MTLLDYIGELQPNCNFIFYIFVGEIFCLPSSSRIQIKQFKLVYWQNIYSDFRNTISTTSLNEMLLNKFFITLLLYYMFKHNFKDLFNCFGGRFLVAGFKHDENCPITFIPSNFPCHILSRISSVRKSIIGERSFFTRKPKCRICRLVISRVLSDLFFISVVLSQSPTFNNESEKENL